MALEILKEISLWLKTWTLFVHAMADTKAVDINSLSKVSVVKLDGASTYLAWLRSCLSFIKSRILLGYITWKKGKKKLMLTMVNGILIIPFLCMAFEYHTPSNF